MLETVREFGLEKLEASGESDEIRQAHAAYYARLAARAEPELTGSDQVAWFDRLEAEHANLRAALEWTIAHDPETGLEMAGALGRFWDHHSHTTEGRRWLEAALTSGDGRPSTPRAKALWAFGGLAIGQGDYQQAERLLADSLETARAVGDRYWSGFALTALGNVTVFLRGDLDRATALHVEGLRLLREVGDRDGIAALLGNLGYVAYIKGDFAETVARSEESLALYRELRSFPGMASQLGNLGRALLELGEFERAEVLLKEGLILSRESGNKWYVFVALEGLAGAATARRRWEHATRLFGAFETLTEANHVALPPSDRATNERYLTTARRHLNEATFMAAWNAGRTMPLDQAIAEALGVVPDEVPDTPPAAVPATAAGLTGRETEVLRLLAQGMSDREIAAALFIGTRTASFHVANLLAKLGVDSRTAAAAHAVRIGLV
jgi:DNA-binding CsgD family transcriptional regulator/tetratricopeptide (TPR) repeat protein